MASTRREYGAFLYQHGESRYYGNAFWQHAWYARDVLCEDGRRRTVRLSQQPDTFFTWPGRADIAGRTRRGYIFQGTDDPEPRFYVAGGWPA